MVAGARQPHSGSTATRRPDVSRAGQLAQPGQPRRRWRRATYTAATPMLEEISLGDFHGLVDLLLIAAVALDDDDPIVASLDRLYESNRGLPEVACRTWNIASRRTRWVRSRCPWTPCTAASTQRAVDNFPISSLRFGRRFIWALGLQKGSSATVAADTGHLDAAKGAAIRQSGRRGHGRQPRLPVRPRHLPDRVGNVDQHQRQRGHRGPGQPDPRRRAIVHPNDDVNFGQSSNDVIPTAIHVAAVACDA